MKDVPISPQGLPTVFVAGLSTVFVADLPAVLFIRRLCGGMEGLPDLITRCLLGEPDPKFI